LSNGKLRSRFTHNVPTSVVTEAELREHLSAVDAPLLLVCAVHATGNIALLDRFADKVGSPRSSIRGPVETPVDSATLQANAELTDIVTRYRDSEVRNILSLGGDPPKELDLPPGELKHAIELINLVRDVGDSRWGRSPGWEKAWQST